MTSYQTIKFSHSFSGNWTRFRTGGLISYHFLISLQLSLALLIYILYYLYNYHITIYYHYYYILKEPVLSLLIIQLSNYISQYWLYNSDKKTLIIVINITWRIVQLSNPGDRESPKDWVILFISGWSNPRAPLTSY